MKKLKKMRREANAFFWVNAYEEDGGYYCGISCGLSW